MGACSALPSWRERCFHLLTNEKEREKDMYGLISIFLILCSNTPISSSDRFLKRSPPHSHHDKSQEYLDPTHHPLPSDHLTPSCTVQAIDHSFGNTINAPPYSARHAPPLGCPAPWSSVVLQFRAAARGDQYDRIAALWLGGAELVRTSTAQPTHSGVFWEFRRDVTRYSSLLSRSDLNFTMMLENIVNDVFTAAYSVKVTLLYYSPDAPPSHILIQKQGSSFQAQAQASWNLYHRPADEIIPISSDGSKGFWFRIQGESDEHSKRIRIPRNTHRAVLELYVSFHGDDEFWYSNPPNSYIKMNNLTTGRGNGAYREVFVTIDGKFAGSEVAFPVIFTGGINPLFWGPVVAIDAFDLPTYDLDLTPFLGLLLDKKLHEFKIGVTDGISYWLVDANLHLWLDHDSSSVQAGPIAYKTPALDLETELEFKELDGSFGIKAKRKTHFAGWVKSSSGNFTTHVLQDFKFRNLIKFQHNGTSKSVNQNVKVNKQVQVLSDGGDLFSRMVGRTRYPLKIITSTIPGKKKDTYKLVTNVSHALREEYSFGDLSSSVRTTQKSTGWMEVRDHDVLSGSAYTQESYDYRDELGCYTRTVAARDGKLVKDNSTSSCISST